MALTSTKFHISLNVSNLERSVDFYRILFGQEPAKLHDDYAKFELADPPVVFSLVPQPSVSGGALGKIGLRVADVSAVEAVRQRLKVAAIPTQAPCDGAPETKCYVVDPDLNYWQIYTGEEGIAPPLTVVKAPQPVATGPITWEHYVSNSLPDRIPHEDSSVDEVRLTGTFNASLSDEQRTHLLKETRRVLRPGGKVLVHGLVGDKPFTNGQPQLPGLAALVSRVPVQTEPVEALKAAGFVGVQFVKLSEKAWFEIDGVELREMKMTAWQPQSESPGISAWVIYRGPFREAVDDSGNVFPRGQRVTVGFAVAEALQKGSAAEQFLVGNTAEPAADSCSREL
jgi:catechol 2,3-dioxygenase-like lactoylglutathione lyase family enzyme